MPGSSRRQNLLILVFLILVAVFVSSFRMGLVRGASMEPTYVNGQVVLVRRLHTLGRKLRRGDVVLVQNDHDVIIKRVFRLAGEELDHSFPDVLTPTLFRDLGDYYEQRTVKESSVDRTHYFVPPGYMVVVGDNIPVSEDSRAFGPVSERDVLGVVVNAPPAPYNNGRMTEQPGGRGDRQFNRGLDRFLHLIHRKAIRLKARGHNSFNGIDMLLSCRENR